MVSEEFKQNVESGDVMTVRSVLGNYLITDTSFQEFDEAFAYAERYMEVTESDDGRGDRDENPDNWDETYLIAQKTFLLMNFSQKRIDHIKKVIQKVWGTTDARTKTDPRYLKKEERGPHSSKESSTGKKTIKEERGDVKRIEEEIHPIDIAAWMIGGGIAMGVIGGIVYGIGSVVAEPVMAHAGLTVAKVGGCVTIAGGVIKIVKK